MNARKIDRFSLPVSALENADLRPAMIPLCDLMRRYSDSPVPPFRTTEPEVWVWDSTYGAYRRG